MKANKRILHIFIILAVIAVNFYFGFPRIKEYTAVDEILWSYDRVPKFWRSVAKGNWRGTNLCDKPGVVLAMISGAGLPFISDPREYEGLRFKQKTSDQLSAIENIYFSLRLPVYLFTLFSLFIFYFLLKRLLGAKIALFSVIFIGLSPIILGISLIVNTDAILWILMPLSLISFLIYQKENNKRFLYLAGFILGLGILTKFVANFLFPFFLILIFVKYATTEHLNESAKITYFKKSMADYLVLVLIALLTIFIFYPSAWIKPRELLNTTIYSMALKHTWPFVIGGILTILADVYLLKSFFSRKICWLFSLSKTFLIKMIALLALSLISFVLINVHSGMKFYDFVQILANPKPDQIFHVEFLSNILTAFFPLIYGLTPIVVVLFISALIFLTKIKDTEVKNNKSLLYAFYFILFIIVYYFANSFASISSTVRYQIIIYPIASIIAAIGLGQFLESSAGRKYLSETRTYFLIFLIIITCGVSLALVRPFYLAYSSDLLPEKYILNLKDMGDGSWEISKYLNNLPGANNLSIWTDKKQVCEKFVGKCDTGFNSKSMKDKRFDYFIASRGGETETMEKAKKRTRTPFLIGIQNVDPKKMYSQDKFYEYKVIINGLDTNFIKVIEAEDLVNSN